MDARVVGLAERIVRLRNELGARLAEGVDAAHVIHVTLGHQDVSDRAVIDGVVEPAVMAGLEAHPRIHHDASGIRHDQIGVRESGREPDALGHRRSRS